MTTKRRTRGGASKRPAYRGPTAKRKVRTASPPSVELNVRAAPILARLPTLGPEETLNIWTNALRLISTSRDVVKRREAQIVADAVEDTWAIRAGNELPEGWFKWPTTHAPGGDGSLNGSQWLQIGPLKLLGYVVGNEGKPEPLRQAILKRVFEGALPPLFPPTYLRAWGAPKSPARLERIADSIASFARSAKRRDPQALAEAIADWEADLRHLHATYYVGRFGFSWPAVGVSSS